MVMDGTGYVSLMIHSRNSRRDEKWDACVLRNTGEMRSVVIQRAPAPC